MKKKNWKNLITEDEFWEIIDKSLIDPVISITEQSKIIEKELSTKSVEELVGFRYFNRELYRKAYTPHLWAAAYLARGGCTDDSFHYFRHWLITRGSKIFKNALENPDNLVREFEKYEYREDIQYESLAEFADRCYRQISGNDLTLDEMIEQEFEEEFDNKSEEEMNQILVFDWEEDDEESLKRVCPKIYERYWKNPLKFKYQNTDPL